MRIISEDWSDVHLRTTPFVWAAAAPGSLIDAEDAQHLARAFPGEGMIRIDESARATGKTYRNYSLPIEPEASLERFPEIWRHFLTDLRSMRYRKRMARLLGQPVAGHLEVRLVRHGAGDWLSPHTDSVDKLFTQVFYFTENWRTDDGGYFEILEREDENAVVERVAPTAGTSVIVCPSLASWHRVAKISTRAETPRQSVLVHAKP